MHPALAYDTGLMPEQLAGELVVTQNKIIHQVARGYWASPMLDILPLHLFLSSHREAFEYSLRESGLGKTIQHAISKITLYLYH